MKEELGAIREQLRDQRDRIYDLSELGGKDEDFLSDVYYDLNDIIVRISKELAK